ncbi:hypothetical protein BsIDN1_01460 [Bacillus safensis]|uniref:Uncharacterized protein n=1 Tax=Bacillus safensis TaxID=561879 RepID=A0A5S9M1I6_BACIA|nr:hypothetical protein BsIDN1_01460 [Bacillus safensis]
MDERTDSDQKRGMPLFKKKKLNGRSFSYEEVKDQIKRQIAMEDLGEKANVKTLWKEAKSHMVLRWRAGLKALNFFLKLII